MTGVRQRIDRELAVIERDEDCAICLAVESGSRAWGFASVDSDYDVRFIYARPMNWYLSIDTGSKRDVIERPVTRELDVSGWDLRKALQLLRKSNPPLLEWLQSSIVYRQHDVIANKLRRLAPDFYSPRATFFHYLHMAQGNLREYLRGEIVWRKKYFYVLRPLLAMRWIERGLGPVPIEFDALVRATVEETDLQRSIADLLQAKRSGAELDRGPRVSVISEFLESEMTRFENIGSNQPVGAGSTAALDEFFREVLATIWYPRPA